MILAILGRKASLLMVAGVDDRAAVVEPTGVDGHGSGEERTREVRPGDVILMKVVALRARRLEDELVLEKAGRRAVQVGEHFHHTRMAGQPSTDGRDVGNGVKCLEETLA